MKPSALERAIKALEKEGVYIVDISTVPGFARIGTKYEDTNLSVILSRYYDLDNKLYRYTQIDLVTKNE